MSTVLIPLQDRLIDLVISAYRHICQLHLLIILFVALFVFIQFEVVSLFLPLFAGDKEFEENTTGGFYLKLCSLGVFHHMADSKRFKITHKCWSVHPNRHLVHCIVM